VHLSTGNYNPATARVYEDLGLFTCDEDLGADLTDLFNYLTGYSNISSFRKLLVAPLNMRAGLERLIRREIGHAAAGEGAHMILKCNSLVDRRMIELLYEASGAGVSIDLIVRGLCSLRPGVQGLSENIRVRSVVGRFLEHSRIYYFRNGTEAEIYLGSADLMTRNIDHRVETLFPIRSAAIRDYLRDQVLALYLLPETRAWQMQEDGSYRQASGRGEEPLVDVQTRLLEVRDNRESMA
jgi:polyphosphate kinase